MLGDILGEIEELMLGDILGDLEGESDGPGAAIIKFPSIIIVAIESAPFVVIPFPTPVVEQVQKSDVVQRTITIPLPPVCPVVG